MKSIFSLFKRTGTGRAGRAADKALIIFRTLSVRPFAYPFSAEDKISGAVLTELMSVLGDGAPDFAVIPLFLSKGKNSSSGTAFIVRKEELIGIGRDLPKGIRILPSPLAFIGEINGSGLVVCVNGANDGLSGILFRDGLAVVCRWMPDGTPPQSMVSWFLEYAVLAGMDIPKTVIKYLDAVTEDDARVSLSESEALYPGLRDFNMSFSAAERAAGKGFAAYTSRILKYMTALGILFLACSGILLIQSISAHKVFSSLPSDVYVKAFGETSPDPIGSAAKKAAKARVSESALAFGRLMADISAIFGDEGIRSGVVLDNLRYGTDRSEIQGTADDAKAAERLRSAFEKTGFTARITDIRQIPSEGARFSIALERGEKE